MTDDRIHETLAAEAAELEARRESRDNHATTAGGGMGASPKIDALHPSATQSWWRKAVLPAAAVLLAIVGIASFVALRDNQPDAEPPPSEVASQAAATSTQVPPAETAATPTEVASSAPRTVPTPFGAPTGRLKYHTVVPGDVLASIAEQYRVTVTAIIDANQLDDPTSLQVGQELLIPPSQVAVETPDVPAPSPTAPIPEPIAVEPITTMCVTRIVAPDVLNLRAEPSLDAPIIAELQPGECGLSIVEGSTIVDNRWRHIDRQVDDTIVRGWASDAFLVFESIDPIEEYPTPPEPPPAPPSVMCVTDIVAPDTLMLRAGPGLGFAVLSELAPDTCQLLALQQVDGWTRLAVPLPSGQVIEGWSSSTYLARVDPAVGPRSEQVTLTFDLSYAISPPDGTRPPDSAAFELLLDDGSLLGRLDTASTVTVHNSVLGAPIQLRAPFANDPYCWWTGPTTATDVRVMAVSLVALCA